MALEHNEVQALKAEILADADERYVRIIDCNETQSQNTKKFAKDDKRIDLIYHDFSVVKKLMWVVASSGIGSIVLAFVELILK